MKIFNWIFGSFFRTFGRFLFYIAVGLLALLLFNGKVNALTYEVAETNSYQSFVSFQPSWATKYVKYGVLNYGEASLGSMYAINSRFETISSDRADNNPILMPGQYLVEFIYFGVGNFGDISCNRITSNFKNINMTSGSWVSNEISSTCVDTYKTTYNGNTAYKLLYSFVYSGTGTNEFDFHLEDIYYAFISPLDTGINYGITMSNIYGYDTIIIDNFKTAKAQEEILNENKETNEKLDTQIQQNETIIDQNNQTNNKLDDLNGNLTSTEGADLGALQNSAGWLPAGPVDSILNLPLSLLNNLTSNLSKSCQPVILPIPYVNKDLTLPCVNTLYDDMGINGWVTTIGVIASAFIMFSYLLKLYKWVDDTLSFRENNSIDNWGGI